MSTSTALLLAAAIMIFLLRSRFEKILRPSKKTRTQTKIKQRKALSAGRYSSASIKSGSCACAKVVEVGDRRFLTQDIPHLPLPGCDQARCACRYIRHADRRKDDDRRALFSLQSDLYSISGGGEDRRIRSMGRRSHDKEVQENLAPLDYDNIEWTS